MTENTPHGDEVENWLKSIQQGKVDVTTPIEPRRRISRRKFFGVMLGASVGGIAVSSSMYADKESEAQKEAEINYPKPSADEVSDSALLKIVANSKTFKIPEEQLDRAERILEQDRLHMEEKYRVAQEKQRFWSQVILASMSSAAVSFIGLIFPRTSKQK